MQAGGPGIDAPQLHRGDQEFRLLVTAGTRCETLGARWMRVGGVRMTGVGPRFPDGWNWDPLSGENGAWLYFRDGRYCAWVMPKAGMFVCNWRLGHRTWMDPYGEDPRHLYTNPYEAMQYAQAMAVSE